MNESFLCWFPLSSIMSLHSGEHPLDHKAQDVLAQMTVSWATCRREDLSSPPKGLLSFSMLKCGTFTE